MEEALLKRSLTGKGDVENCQEVCPPARGEQASEIRERDKEDKNGKKDHVDWPLDGAIPNESWAMNMRARTGAAKSL